MDRDKQLYKLFAAAPAQMYELLGLRVPGPLWAHSQSFKELQTEADLVVEPAAEAEPARLVEFQGYRDKQFVPKVMLRCPLYRMQHPSRAVRCHIIYLDREYESAAVDDGGLSQPHVHVLAGTIPAVDNSVSVLSAAERLATVAGGERTGTAGYRRRRL